MALLVLLVALTGCDPAAPPIGQGCQWHPDTGDSATFLNLSTAFDPNGDVADAAINAVNAWNAAKHWATKPSEAPRIHHYYPGGAGHGTFELRTYGQAGGLTVNSGWMSTTGPPGFPLPTCGTTTWASRPNLWINLHRATAEAQAGHQRHTRLTVGHEIGHAFGIDHTPHQTSCAGMPLMEPNAASANACAALTGPTAVDVQGVNNIYN